MTNRENDEWGMMADNGNDEDSTVPAPDGDFTGSSSDDNSDDDEDDNSDDDDEDDNSDDDDDDDDNSDDDDDDDGIPIAIGDMFTTEESLTIHMETYAKYNHFDLAKRTTYYSKEKSEQLFGSKPPEPKRLEHGFFYCTGSKNNGIKCACNFQVGFSYFSKKKAPGYYIKSTSFNLEHTDHERSDVTYNENFFVKKKRHLKPEELAFLRDAAMFQENSGIVRERMNMKFPGRIFDAKLLRRQLRSLVQEIHGKNGMSMDRIMMIGHNDWI